MNRRKLVMLGIIALMLAAIVSLFTYRILRVAFASANANTVPVVVAAVDIDTGSGLQEKDLRVAKLPLSELPQGVFHSASEIIGRGVLVPISKNEIVLNSKLAAEHAGAGLPSMIPAGMRAVSVKVNDVVSVAGFVIPGTRVDVLLTGNPSRNNDPRTISTTTVLQNIVVLAAGTKLQRTPDGQPQNVPVITLLVSPDDAQKLTLASSEGKIQLALRNPLDADAEPPAVLRNAALYHEGSPTATKRATRRKQGAPPSAPVYVVEMIRGDKRDAASFEEK